MIFMDNSSFYLFDSKGYLTTFAVRPLLFDYAILHDLHEYDSGRDIHYQLLFGDDESGEYPDYLQFPVAFRYLDGRIMRDLLDMRYPHCFLISDRVRDLLGKELITGWKPFPIILFDKQGEEIKGYNGFTVTGRSGSVCFSIDRKDIPIGEMKKYVFWNNQQWDGSDIFLIKPNYMVCTQRVIKLLKSHNVDALSYQPLGAFVTIVGTDSE